MLGITCKWECPSCGSVMKTNSPFWDEKKRKAHLREPSKCSCGRKSAFKLVDFEKCIYVVLNRGQKVIDSKGNAIEMSGEDSPTTTEEDD